MSFWTAFSATFTWLWNTAFGTIRPVFNPLIGDRPLYASGTSMMEPRALLQRRPRPGGIFRGWNRSSSETETINNPPKSDVWQPAIVDVLRTRKLLYKASKARLPLELINTVLDFAEYWPHVSASKERSIVAVGNTSHQDVLVVRTPPICALATAGCEDDSLGLPEPTLLHPVRKVVFRIRSRDQGFSGEAPETKGTYQASYTWFDAEIDKEFGPLLDDEPLSRIPWELSSTRFLDAWPRHAHQQEDNQEERDRLHGITGEPYLTGQQSPHSQQSEDETTSSNSEASPNEQSGSSNNPEHPERPKPRLFSHQYLQNHKYEVQYNIQSKREITEHTVEWRYTDDIAEDSPEADELVRLGRGRATGDGIFVRCLQIGDCVSLWAKARHPQWKNHIETATVEVYFAI